MMAFVGKYPNRIKHASFDRGNIWVLTLNNGRTHRIPASQIAGLMPKPGEEISKYIDAGLPMVKLAVNPIRKVKEYKPPKFVYIVFIERDDSWMPEAGFSDLSQAKMFARSIAKIFKDSRIKVEKKS
jgi:hypothetical protein